MKITELTLTDFRAFAGTHRFELASPFTVVAGVNGRGKTAILDAIALLTSRLLRSLGLSTGDQRSITVSDIHGEAEVADLSMRAVCGGEIPIIFGQRRRRNQDRGTGTWLPPQVRSAVLHAYGDVSRPDDQAPVAIYYTTDRAGYRIPRVIPAELPPARHTAYVGALINRTVDYRDFMARYRVWAMEENNAVSRSIDHALSQLIGGIADIQVETDPARLSFQKGTSRIMLSQLSDGERAIIAVVGDMVRRLALANPDLEDPLTGHGVVLIDELELHLHPKWQRDIVDSLRRTFPNIQFIATTHSPFVIQSLRPGELINLDPDEFGEYADRSIEDISENVMGVDQPQKSTRYLKMMASAERYFHKLEVASRTTDTSDLSKLKSELDELSVLFDEDPAFTAFLKFQRGRVLLEDE